MQDRYLSKDPRDRGYNKYELTPTREQIYAEMDEEEAAETAAKAAAAKAVETKDEKKKRLETELYKLHNKRQNLWQKLKNLDEVSSEYKHIDPVFRNTIKKYKEVQQQLKQIQGGRRTRRQRRAKRTGRPTKRRRAK